MPSSDGTRLYVRRRGEGRQVVVLCDGILCDGFVYRHLWESLPVSTTLVHWNYRGHGRSGDPVDTSRIAVSDHSADLRMICRHFGFSKVVLVGHSFGVSVVLEAAQSSPDLISGMVLLCGTAGSVTNTFRGTDILSSVLPKLRQAAEEHPRLARGLWSRLPAGFASNLAVLTGEVNRASVDRRDIQPYFDHLRHINPSLAFRMLEQASRHSSEAGLAHIRTPALVVAGSRDTFIPPEQSRRLSQGLLASEFHLLDGGTHICPLEYPQRLLTLIHNFVVRVGEAA